MGQKYSVIGRNFSKSRDFGEDVVHDVFPNSYLYKNFGAIAELKSYFKISAQNQVLKILKKRCFTISRNGLV